MSKNIAIIGSSGAIGNAFVEHYLKDNSIQNIFTFSRNAAVHSSNKVSSFEIDIESQDSIKKAAQQIQDHIIDRVIIASGILHNESFGPEKSIKDLNYETFAKVYSINTIGPALIGRYFIPLMNKNEKSVIAFLSARVGSISDNKLGGWYSYRSSKTALNQIVKNFSIELKRTNKNAIVLALQPGTVESNFSEPFQKNVSKEKLFSPKYSAKLLYKVIEESTPQDSGNLIAFDGETITP
jgi:NAD(P)-dependent dehydrogenase (short-subunit alcohol dehydrogenase family)